MCRLLAAGARFGILMLGVLLLPLACLAAAEDARPNILFILMDRYCVGCHDGATTAEGRKLVDLRALPLRGDYRGHAIGRYDPHDKLRTDEEVRRVESLVDRSLPPLKNVPPGNLMFTPAYEALLPLVRRMRVEDTPELERATAPFITGKYVEAEAAATRLGSSAPETAKAWQLAGRSAVQLGQLDRAMKHFRTAASLVSQQREPLEWAGMQRNMAIVLMATGQLHDAEVIWRPILDTHLKHLKPQHPDVLGARNVLAATLSREGKFAEAADQYREVIAVLEEVRGADDPDTLRARQNLERATKAQGRSKPGNE